MTTRVVVVEMPEGSPTPELVLAPPVDPAVEQFSRAPASKATNTADYLGALLARSPTVVLQVQVGPNTLNLAGTREEALALVFAAYAFNGRAGIDELMSALRYGTRPGQAPPPRPTAPPAIALDVWTRELLDPEPAELAQAISAAQDDLRRVVVDDLVQLEDANTAVYREAFDTASKRIKRDRAELLSDSKAPASFRSGEDGAPVPRAAELIDACQRIAELDQQIDALLTLLGIARTVAAAIAPPLLLPTALPDPGAPDPEKLKAIADALTAGSKATRETKVIGYIVSEILAAAAELARETAHGLEVLQPLLYQLLKWRTLLVEDKRRRFSFIEILMSELGSTIDAASVAAATDRALIRFQEACDQLTQDLEGGRMAVIRGTERVPRDRYATVPTFDEVPFLDRFLDARVPEEKLARGIGVARDEGRVTVWDQPQVVRLALKRIPQSALAQNAWLEVDRQMMLQGRRDLALGVGLVGLHLATRGALAAVTFGTSEVLIELAFLVDGIKGALVAYSRYQKEGELELAAAYVDGGLITVDPSLLPVLLNALGAISSVATLARLKTLAKVLDVTQLGIVGYELAPLFARALAEESPQTN